jgi:putative flippase GtrA
MKFLIVGTLNTILDLTLYFTFANWLGIYPVISSILSTGLTMIISFFLNHHFVFQSDRKRSQTAVRFVLVTLFNVWLIQSLVIFGSLHVIRNVHFFIEHKWTKNLFAKLCGVAVSFVLNFAAYRYIFHERQREEESPVL